MRDKIHTEFRQKLLIIAAQMLSDIQNQIAKLQRRCRYRERLAITEIPVRLIVITVNNNGFIGNAPVDICTIGEGICIAVILHQAHHW